LALRTWLMGVLKSLGTPFRTCVRRAFWQYHYLRAFLGVDTGFLELKVTGVFTTTVPYTAESHTSGGGLSGYSSSREHSL